MDLVTTHDFQYVVADGETIAVDTFATVDAAGELVAATATDTIKVIGVNTVDLTGDGVVKAAVRFGKMVLATNSGTTALTAADIGGPCYIAGPETVSGNTAASEAGTVVGFVGNKVLVKLPI